MALHTRLISDDPADGTAWVRAASTGFLTPPDSDPEGLERRRANLGPGRTRGAFDGERCVATFRSFDQQLTVADGRVVTADAISAVTVTATHRRRGLLSRLMAEDLAEAKERGDAAATLVAAEYAIYGRFGFGPATLATSWRVHGPRTGLDQRWSLPDSEGSLSFADGAEIRKIGPELHERFRLGQPGAIDRDERFWRIHTGELQLPPGRWEEPFHVVHRDAAGVPQGMATYTTDTAWEAGVPAGTAEVGSLFATTPAAEAALWRFVLSLDWITTVVSKRSSPDSVLPLILPNPRAAEIAEQTDFLWLRPLDLPALLGPRTYAAEGELVLDVRDPMGLAEGRYLLTASPEGGEAVPTGRTPDLVLGTGALAQLYLGNESAARLVAAGLAEAETTRAAARADLLFHTGRRPWCPDIF